MLTSPWRGMRGLLARRSDRVRPARRRPIAAGPQLRAEPLEGRQLLAAQPTFTPWNGPWWIDVIGDSSFHHSLVVLNHHGLKNAEVDGTVYPGRNILSAKYIKEHKIKLGTMHGTVDKKGMDLNGIISDPSFGKGVFSIQLDPVTFHDFTGRTRFKNQHTHTFNGAFEDNLPPGQQASLGKSLHLNSFMKVSLTAVPHDVGPKATYTITVTVTNEGPAPLPADKGVINVDFYLGNSTASVPYPKYFTVRAGAGVDPVNCDANNANNVLPPIVRQLPLRRILGCGLEALGPENNRATLVIRVQPLDDVQGKPFGPLRVGVEVFDTYFPDTSKYTKIEEYPHVVKVVLPPVLITRG